MSGNVGNINTINQGAENINTKSGCLVSPLLLTIAIFLIWGSMCCLIWINRRDDARLAVEEEEHFSNRNSSNNGNNGNNDNRQKDIDTFDGFLTDLENRMDTIENRKRLCQQLVDTSPDGEKNSYHTVYHQSYKKMKKLNEKDGSGKDKVVLRDFTPTKSLATNTVQFAYTLNGYNMMLRSMSESSKPLGDVY